MQVDNLVIEITRKCNMKCEHCLRGKAQNKCISQAVLYHTFRKISYVNTLTITGGEPSLAVEELENLVQIIKNLNCQIGNFYIVTNAKYLTTRFFEALEALYYLCTENEISQIQYSSDRFHYNQKHIERLKYYFNEEKYLQNGCGDYLVSPKGEIHNVLKEGNAENWGCSENNSYPFQAYKYDDEIMLQDEELYINVNGDIIKGCNWSYKSQEQRKIGNIIQLSSQEIIDIFNEQGMIEWEEENETCEV